MITDIKEKLFWLTLIVEWGGSEQDDLFLNNPNTQTFWLSEGPFHDFKHNFFSVLNGAHTWLLFKEGSR